MYSAGTNTPLYNHMSDDMDINAGEILSGRSLESVGREIFEKILSCSRDGLDAAEDDRRAPFAHQPADFVAAQRVAGVDADADDVTVGGNGAGQVQVNAGFDDEGYWAVTRHADILAVSKAPDVYSSEENTALIRFKEGIPRESIEMQRIILLNMDPPQHTRMRGIVSRGFTPRAIGNLRQVLTERAERIVATALDSGTGDFVTDVAAELPLQAISDLIGVPQEDRGKIFAWSNRMIGYDDELPGEENAGEMAAIEILGYSMTMAEERRGCPRDDIVTKLISAEIDGHGLSDDEFGYFVLMLAVAGNETTRNAITHGMNAFFDHPEQWEQFKASRPDTAADEIVRWATPITVFQRTATWSVPRILADSAAPVAMPARVTAAAPTWLSRFIAACGVLAIWSSRL